jgi:hypothetical protein
VFENVLVVQRQGIQLQRRKLLRQSPSNAHRQKG